MRIRTLEQRDMPTIQSIHEAAGYKFPWPSLESPQIEAALVVVDSADTPVAASLALRVPEILMAMRRQDHPVVKLQELALIHGGMRTELAAKGYRDAFCFLPPELERGYGRHLQRHFGWIPMWKTYGIRKDG